MSRGRRGGRRQRRREEQARQAAQQNGQPPREPDGQPPAQTNGQSGPASVVIPERAAQPGESAPAQPVAPAPAQPVAPPPVPAHPRPMSARELVARMEALRAQEAHEAASDAATGGAAHASVGDESASAVAPPEPRRFRARDDEWIASHAGRGAGGTGRIAHARLEAIHFARAVEPETVVTEVLAPHAHLDDLYDDELAELLERGLRYTKDDG